MKLRKAERKAKEVFEQYGNISPPVRVEEIAEQLGAALHYEPFNGDDDISGVLLKDAEKCVIGINSAHPKTRQRFSIAHEIGHLVLHDKKELFIDKVVRVNFRNAKSSMAIDHNEIEANQFAAELLMPRELVRQQISTLVSKRRSMEVDDLVSTLASVFEVSSQSMEFRLNNLGFLVSS